MDIPGYSYRFRIFNLTKDQAGSYMGMHDYRKNYGPLYNTRFGGTYPPIPPLLGDPRQPRLAWYLKKYAPPTPPANYIEHVMDTINDGQLRDRLYEKQLEPETRKQVSVEWYTVRPKNESNYFYEEDKVKPRFGDYGGIAIEDAFPAYKPKEPYEVVMVPERQPIYKRSVEISSSKEDTSEIKIEKKKSRKPDSYSSNSYTYEQFNSNESISGPFTNEQSFSSDSESSVASPSDKVKGFHKEKRSAPHSTEKKSAEKHSLDDDYFESVSELYSKSESFPAPLNTGEVGRGAQRPPKNNGSASSESLDLSPPKYEDFSYDDSVRSVKSSQSEEKKSGDKSKSSPQNSPKVSAEKPYPRMKPENDSEVQRDSSGLENESFPSSMSSDHSSDMLLWDAVRNYSAELQPISESSKENLQKSKNLEKENNQDMDSSKNKVKLVTNTEENKREKRGLKWKPPTTTTKRPDSSSEQYSSWGSTEEELLYASDSFPPFEDIWPKSFELNNGTQGTGKPTKKKNYPKKRGKNKERKGGKKRKPMKWKREIKESVEPNEFWDEVYPPKIEESSSSSQNNDSSSTYLRTEEIPSTSSALYIPSFDSFGKSSEHEVSDPSSYSSGELSSVNMGSDSSSKSSEFSISKEKDPKGAKKDSEKAKKDSKKAKKDSKKAKKDNTLSKKDSKTAKKNTVGKTKEKNVVDVPPVKNPRKLNFAEKKGEEESDSSITNPWGDISYVEETPVDPPEIRTFPPTFTEPYVAPLHHQPDDFWDEIYGPDTPDPTLAPYQQEEEDRKARTTTWKPPIITTRDPTSKPRFIYVTNEDTSDAVSEEILRSSQEEDKEVPKQHNLGLGLGLTKTQLQLRQIMKLKNKAKGLQKAKNRIKQNDNNKEGMIFKGKDKGRKEKKKPKKKDKEKKYNPNNFSRPNPDEFKVQGRSETQPEGMIFKGKDKGRKEKKKPKKKDKEKKYNPNNFSRPNPDEFKVQGHSETQSVVRDPLHNGPKGGNVIGDPLHNIQKGIHKIEDPLHHLDNYKIHAAVTPFVPDYSFSESRPEGNYEWPSLIHPKFNPTELDELVKNDPILKMKEIVLTQDYMKKGLIKLEYLRIITPILTETAYDDEGYPVHESPDWTSPTTHRKDRIMGRERTKVGVRGRGIVMPKFMKRIQENVQPHGGAPHPVMSHSATADHAKVQPHNVGTHPDMVHGATAVHVNTDNHILGPHPILAHDAAAGHVNTDSHIVGTHPDLSHGVVPGHANLQPHNGGPHPEMSHIATAEHNIKIDLLHSPINEKKSTKDSTPLHNNINNFPHIQIQSAGEHIRQKRYSNTKPPSFINKQTHPPKPWEQKWFSEDMELKPSPKNWPEPTYPKGRYKMNPNTMFKTPPSIRFPQQVQTYTAKLKQVVLNHKAVNQFQAHKDEALNPLLHGNQNLFKAGPHLDTEKEVKNAKHKETVDSNIHAVNLHAEMEKSNLGHAQAKRSVKEEEEDPEINPLLFGNQNLFKVDRKSSKAKENLEKHNVAYNPHLYGNQNSRKKDEALNPLLYGNQNLFSANHNDYIKLSDIHSPFAKPPYGIPIDGEIKRYNDGFEAPSPSFIGNMNGIKSRQQTWAEKMNLLRMLQEKRAKLRAAARLPAPVPPDHEHVINKRDTWEVERLHPMLYGQQGIFKPKHARYNTIPINKDIHWMPYVNMQAARLMTSNPKAARARLREYSKFMGRDVHKMREAIRLRDERRRKQQQSPLHIPIDRHNREYRRALLRNGIIPEDNHNMAETRIHIKPKNEIDDRSWMPYVNMNAVMANAIKKTEGNHRIQKRDIETRVDGQEAQQPFAVTSGYRRKRTTHDLSDEPKTKNTRSTKIKKTKRRSKKPSSVEDMFASYFDHSPSFTMRTTSTMQSPLAGTTVESSFEEYKDEIEDVTAYHGFMYWTRPPSKPPRTHIRYTKPTPKPDLKHYLWPGPNVKENYPIYISNTKPPPKPLDPIQARFRTRATPKYAPQWMLDKDRNIYNPRLSSKEMHERIKARERKPIRRNRRYNWHSRTHSDKYYDHLYHTTAQTTKTPSTSKTYIPNVTVGNIPKDEMFYEKLFNPVTRVVGATRRTYIPNVRIMHTDFAQYTTPKNYMENYEIPITKVLGKRSSDKKGDETKYRIHGSSEARKWLYGQQNDNAKAPENYMRPTIVPFKSHPNFKLHDQWVARPWGTRRPRRARRTYLTRAPNGTYRTLRNFESPVTWPDGHIEPPYDYSMTNKTYPPEYYDKLNASTYDEYNVVSHEGWVDSEYHRWHGQRAAGLPLESVDDDYYSEYANWYLKKRDNSTENRMFEVYDSKAPRPPRPTYRTRTPRRKKKYRGLSDVSEVSEYERGMRKRLDETFKQMMNKILDTTDRTIDKRMDKYMKLLKNGSFTSDMLKGLPFKDFFPPESYFRTTTSEACDTSSMQRYFLHGRPGYPQKKEVGKHTMDKKKEKNSMMYKYPGGFKGMLNMMKQRKDKLKNIKRSAVLLQKLTDSFKLGVNKGLNNTAKKAKFVFTDSLQEEMMKQIERRLSKGKPNADLIPQLTEDIYERIGHRYQQNKTIGHVVNQTHSRVVGGGRSRSYVPHATVRVRLDKKTGQYEMNIWAPKTDFREERVGKVNGTLKVDQKLKDRLKEKIQSDTRNFLANESKLDKDKTKENVLKAVDSIHTEYFQKEMTTSQYWTTFPLNIKKTTPRYENIQTINSFSETKHSKNEEIITMPSKKTEIRARRVGRPTVKKSMKVTRGKRSSRKGRPTGSRHITTRTRKLPKLKSEEILKEVSTMKIYSKESIVDTKQSITQQPGKKGESLRKSLDKQIKMLFKQTQAMQEKGAKVNPYRPPDFSVLDNIEKEIGSIAANWPDDLRRTTLHPNYAEHTIKVDRFTMPTKSELYTSQNRDYIKVKTPSVKPTIKFNKDTQTFNTKIQTTIRPEQKETVSPTIRRMVDRHFTYLPRVFTFHPITLKAFVPTTRRRYVFTPKFIYDTEEDSISDSDITRAPLYTTKHKTKKQTKVLHTLSTVKPTKSIVKSIKPKLISTSRIKPTKSIVKSIKPKLISTSRIKPTKSIVKSIKPKLISTSRIKPTESIVKSIKPKLISTSRVIEGTTIKSLLDTTLHVRSSTIVPQVKPVVTKSTKFVSVTDFTTTKQLPTVKEIKINMSESITEKTNLFIRDITQHPFYQATTYRQPHYFTFGTVRGGFKQYDANWWKLSNRNRGRGSHSRFGQPLHLRGKTFSQRPHRSFNRNKPFNSVRTFLSGIRKASSDVTEKDTQSDLSTLVPFLQSKIRKFYENTPVSLKRTIRPYYNIRLHPMNPVDSVEHSTLSSTEDEWTRNDVFTSDESPSYNKTIANTTSIDELIQTSVKTAESDKTVKKEEFTSEPKPESIMDTSSKVKDRIHIKTAITSDEVNTITQLAKTTVKSKIKITSSVDKKTPLKLNKPKIISVFSPASSYESPTSVPVSVFPKLATTRFSWPTYLKETKPALTTKSVSSEETPSTDNIVWEIVKTTEELPMEAHMMTVESIPKVVSPTYKLSSIQHSIKPNFTTRRSSISSHTVKLKEKLFSSTVPTKTATKTKFKFVWPTKKVETTQALKITTAPTFLLSTSLTTNRTTQPEITTEMTTSVRPTHTQIKTYPPFNPEIFDNSYAKFVWPTFKLPTTSQLIPTTGNLIPTLEPAKTQTVSNFTTDKSVPRFTFPPFQAPASESVIPKLTTEFIPRVYWPTFQRHYTFRPKRVMRNYKNPRWIVRPREWPQSNRAFRARPTTRIPYEEMRVGPTYGTTADLSTVRPTTDSEILTYSETSQQIDKTDETSETTDPNYVTTEKPKTLLTTVKKTAPEMLWPPYQTEGTVEPIVTTYKTIRSTFKQSAPEIKWPPYQETSTLQTKINITSKRTVHALDSAQYPDLDEYLIKTTRPTITTTSAPRNRTKKTHPTKWWVNYIYPDLYRKHVVDSSFENYSDEEEEDDYTILPFDHNTTGTPYYSKLRFGGTWYTFRPIYVRPTTPEPPTTTELTTPPPTTPTPKRTRIHHIIKKGFKKILNIFSFGKRRKQNEEVSE